MSFKKEKQAVALEVIKIIPSSCRLGVGTGSTIEPFIKLLIKRYHEEKLNLQVVATSRYSKELLSSGGIPLLSESLDTPLDLAIDGADEIDPNFCLIKGGGAALFREKLVATAAKELVIIADESKLSSELSSHPLPVEIEKFGVESTLKRLESPEYRVELRMDGPEPKVTDNGNYIADLHYHEPIRNPEEEHIRLKQVLGVLETGLFFNLVKRVFIGYRDGRVLKHDANHPFEVTNR